MLIPERQTFLGGERASARWEELTPHELVLAAQGSPGQAEAILPLVNDQIGAARAKEDTIAEREYVASRQVMLGILGLTASAREVALELESGNRHRDTDEFWASLNLVERYYDAYGAETAPFSYQALHEVAKQFMHMSLLSGNFYILESHFAEYRRLLGKK